MKKWLVRNLDEYSYIYNFEVLYYTWSCVQHQYCICKVLAMLYAFQLGSQRICNVMSTNFMNNFGTLLYFKYMNILRMFISKGVYMVSIDKLPLLSTSPYLFAFYDFLK